MRIPHLKRWVLRFQPIWWLTFVFTFSRLPRHFKKEFYTIFNSLGCAESKDNKIFILGLELVNVLPKVYIGITFVQIECNLVIICYKVNLLYIIPPILILEYKYCYFLILLRLDCWELYKTICQGVMEAKKLETQKCASIWMKPHYSPFQIWCSHYIFVNNFFQFYSRNKYTAIFGFCKGWAVEKCTEAVLKMFWKPRNEQNKSRYFFLKHPVSV